MRTAYHQQLASLIAQPAQACALATAAVQRATRALLTADLELASRVVRDHQLISSVADQARREAFVLLALQAPVAGDLRAVIGAIQNVADVERMGVLALHVADIAARRYPQHALPQEMRATFAEMGRIAADLSDAAHQALLSTDPDAAALIPLADDEMDRLHRHVFSVLLDGQWTHSAAATVDITLLSEFYERFADHAVELARGVVFRATGQFPTEQRSAIEVFGTADTGRADSGAAAELPTGEPLDVATNTLVSAGARGTGHMGDD